MSDIDDQIQEVVQIYKDAGGSDEFCIISRADYDRNWKQAENEARMQTALNMQVQWKQERIGHTLSRKVEEWKTELDHFDEFAVKFIAQLRGEDDE